MSAHSRRVRFAGTPSTVTIRFDAKNSARSAPFDRDVHGRASSTDLPEKEFTDSGPEGLLKPGSMKIDMFNQKAFVSDRTVISAMPRRVVSDYQQSVQNAT